MIQELVELLVEAQLQEEVMWAHQVEQLLVDLQLLEVHQGYIKEVQLVLRIHVAVL